MKKINVNITDNSYPIYVGQNILDDFAEVFNGHIKSKQIAIISSANIFALYGKELKQRLPSQCQIIEHIVPDGEQTKSIQFLQELWTALLENHFERSGTIIALGGGVIGDLAGFVAATYLRGINFVQVPTTLLAQVDSSIGGKTGINHPLGKNLIGAFKQPVFVFSDVAFLRSLPEEEIRCGMGEVIKYAFFGDKDLFSYLENNIEKALSGDIDVLLHLVDVSARQKADVVAQDEKEAGLRMILNFGHTFGHALEAEFGYSNLKHGEAVILGMKCALEYSKNTGLMDIEEYTRGINLLERVPVKYDKNNIKIDALVERMFLDKKVVDKNIRLILVDQIGSYVIKDESELNQIRTAFEVLI
ncbi:MAG: 3-dehydroquinate synthase [Calditrichaeota bacterium]|nr:3-dehydroquinate synthase [Calditrichota bacterium]